MQLKSSSEKDTVEFAKEKASEIFKEIKEGKRTSIFLYLSGDVGAGKTTFSRAFIEKWYELQNIPLKETITSPTFSLVNTYNTPLALAHFDLYRIDSLEELSQLDFESYFYETPVCIVEWLEKIPDYESLLPENSIQIKFIIKSETTREISFNK